MKTKKHFLYSLMIIFWLFIGCSESDDIQMPSSEDEKQSINTENTSINEEEAIRIADYVRDKIQSTRSTESIEKNVEYVVNRISTRSSVTSDTVAYVVNYHNQEGFVIVSSD